MSGKIKLCLAILFVLIKWNHAVGQFEPQKVVEHYSLKQGLSQGVVNSIAEDSQSFLWFATEDGLNRFDGSSVKVFKYRKSIDNGFVDNFIQSIFKDKEGSLWISSRSGLVKFDPAVEKFKLFEYDFGAIDKASPNDVSDITEGASNNLWVTWYTNGFGSFDKTSEKFTAYNSQNLPSLSSEMTVSILEDEFGLLWVGTQDGGLNVFNVRDGKVISKIGSLSNPAELSSSNVRCIVQDSKMNIWIGTSRGLVMYFREQNKFINFNFDQALQDKSVFSLETDADDNLWVGTQGNGLYHLDLRQVRTHLSGNLSFEKIESLNEFDISNKTIQSLFEDSNKNLWVGTFGDGVYMVSNEEERFIKFQKFIHKGSTSTAVSFYGITYDRDGNIWLGTDGNGLYKRNATTKEETHYVANGKPGDIKDNTILSALTDSQGRSWFGSYSNGLFQYDKKTDSFLQFKYAGINANRPGVNDIRVIFEDSNKNIWIGTNRGGLCLVDMLTRTYQTPEQFTDVLMDGDIRTITEDTNGNLWLGFYGDGVYRYNFTKNELTPFFHEGENKIETRVFYSLIFDDRGRLWIGSAGSGVSVYDPKNHSFQNYTEEQGLINNTVYAIRMSRNSVWLSTNSGIARVDLDSFAITNYQEIDGLQEGQFNPGSGLSNFLTGYMCFGGTQGLNVFYPDQIREIVQTPDVTITNVQIFNKPIGIGDSLDGKPVLLQDADKLQLTLNHDQSVITFDFVGLDFTHPDQNFYAYRLDGLDEEWNYVGHQHSATYRYLTPGSYEFWVKSSNKADEWGESYTRVAVIINPPIWKTTYAYIFYLISAILIGYFIISYGRKQISLRRRLKIEKAQRKQEKRMAMDKLTFFTEISHEFRTPLTLIMGPLEEMLSKEDSHSPNARKLNMVHRNASKLLNLINKLLDYRKVESGKVILKISNTDIIPFIKEIVDSFKDLATKKNITYTFTSEIESSRMWFDKEKMEMVLNNILSNSFKYIGNGDEIIVKVSQQISDKYPLGRIVIKVKDNGIGIPKKHLGSIFDWFHKGSSSGMMNSGIGLSLARKLVNLHKGDIYVESAEGVGSTFSIKVPLGKDHFEPEEVTIVEDEPQEQHSPSVLSEDNSGEVEGSKKAQSSVLIIEDDEEIRQFLCEYFEKDYKIIEAGDGNEGYEKANTLHPDLIISDIMMPGKDGIELCRLLKASMRTSHIPVILLTARTSSVHQKEGIEIGADAYITKPFSPEMLSLTVSNLLESRVKLMRFYRNLFIDNENAQNVSKDTLSPDEQFLHTVCEQLLENIEKPDFNVAELADTLNMSRSLVYKKIKMLTGLAPVKYVRSLRMQEAAKLLKTHQYKVFEVVYMVGFSDLKYFRQCFAAEFGVSPSEYMKEQSKSVPNEE